MKKEHLPLTVAHWGTYRAETRNGRLTALHGFERDEDVSPIAKGYIDTLDNNLRIRRPMIRGSWLKDGAGSRTELRGTDSFVAVPWDEAEEIVAHELERVRSTHGNQAIFAGSYGWASAGRFHHAQSQVHRFLNCIGGYTKSVNTYSFAAAEVIVPHVLGDFWGPLGATTSWASIAKAGELVVAFGGMPLKNGQVTPGGVGEHRQAAGFHAAINAGVEVVNVSPIRSDVETELRPDWVALRPNTDTALMLGLAQTLECEGLLDRSFLATHTVGYDRFKTYLTGDSDGVAKDADWASRITEIPADRIRDLARRMASKRTMISVSWSLTRQDHGEQPYWMAITLAAMLGQIGLPGGGIGFGYSASNNMGDDYNSLPAASLPQGKNDVDAYIPVAHITRMLENPGGAFDYNGDRRTFPDIDLVYWAGGNPFHHHQDLNRLVRAWQKPSTIIVHDWTWNALAKRADIVLPCTTTLEREDLAISPYDPQLTHMSKIIEPIGETRDDYEIFAGIARKMGVESAFTEGRTSQDWLRWLYDETRERAHEQGFEIPAFDALIAQGTHFLGRPDAPKAMLEDFRKNPETCPLTTPSGKIEIFSDTIHAFGYTDCPGHPAWIEPVEWLGGETADYPLHLISNQPTRKLHSQLDHSSHCREIKIKGREALALNPADAAQRGLSDGDIVRVFNARGACLAGVVVDDNVRPSVAQMSTGAWYDPDTSDAGRGLCKHGNPNVLTLDKGTSSLAQGPIAHTCMVQVEKFDGDLPALSAFEPPKIVDWRDFESGSGASGEKS
jgi:biotin/methionine sulfoxide reductase